VIRFTHQKQRKEIAYGHQLIIAEWEKFQNGKRLNADHLKDVVSVMDVCIAKVYRMANTLTWRTASTCKRSLIYISTSKKQPLFYVQRQKTLTKQKLCRMCRVKNLPVEKQPFAIFLYAGQASSSNWKIFVSR
ncbi:MAG TPA: hypothetical protein VFT06_14855, partial [Flavisolibacter sp.]|nr:hypothetical protein [Flavisolibacter sp.]